MLHKIELLAMMSLDIKLVSVLQGLVPQETVHVFKTVVPLILTAKFVTMLEELQFVSNVLLQPTDF